MCGEKDKSITENNSTIYEDMIRELLKTFLLKCNVIFIIFPVYPAVGGHKCFASSLYPVNKSKKGVIV